MARRHPELGNMAIGQEPQYDDNRSAFTLVEVLIVVVILTILAAAVVPQFMDSTVDARQSVMLHNLATLRTQTNLYRAQHNGVAPTSNVIAQLTTATNADGTTTGTPTLGPYLVTIPPNPQLDEPKYQSEVQIIDTDPKANSPTAGWIYNSMTGRFFSGTDVTQ
ncbi:MAG: prepilin-type N-terminal cleavage/methylation domain-containing protein [Pirellulaceae bacterium]